MKKGIIVLTVLLIIISFIMIIFYNTPKIEPEIGPDPILVSAWKARKIDEFINKYGPGSSKLENREQVNENNRIAKPLKDSININKPTKIEYSGNFTQEQFNIMSKGLTPKSMDNKWYSHYKDMDLYLCNTWSGQCSFKLIIEKHDNNYKIACTGAKRPPIPIQSGHPFQSNRATCYD